MRTLALLAIAPLVLLAGCGDSGSDGTTVDAVVNVSPPAGTVITDFVFDASGSTTGSRDLEFRWDWNGDGTWDTDWSADALVSHRFAEGGSLSVYIEVTDGSDSDIATVPVLVDAAHGAMQTLFSFPASASPRDLAYDGSHIWITNWNLPTYKLDAVTGDSLGTIPGNSAWTGGITWDGTYLWTVGSAGGMRIFKQDPANGDVLDSFVVIYSAHASGLDWDGSVFYYGSSVGTDGGDGHIHVYTPGGAEVSSFPSPRGSEDPWGVAFDGVNAWVTIDGSDSLYVVDPADGDIVRTVYVPGLAGSVEIVDDHLLVVTAGDPHQLVRIVP